MKPLEQKGKSVIWAVDPFEKELQPPAAEVRELVEFVRRSGLQLLPVYVITVLEKQWETGELPRVPELQAALDRYLSHFSLGEDVRARLLVEESGRLTSAVQSLLDLAKAEEAAWITVSTHGRHGVERLVLGSFAELLVEQSPWPVLFLPRQAARPATRASRVALFPTDLGPAAHAAFTRFLALASHQRLEIVLFHALSYPVPSMDFGLGPMSLGPILPETFVEDQTVSAKEAGERLVQEARAAGVKARFMLHAGLMPSFSGRAVLEAARRENARMIAMPSMTGPLTRFVAGTVAQEVFRAGRTLTWLYGPKALGARDSWAA